MRTGVSKRRHIIAIARMHPAMFPLRNSKMKEIINRIIHITPKTITIVLAKSRNSRTGEFSISHVPRGTPDIVPDEYSEVKKIVESVENAL